MGLFSSLFKRGEDPELTVTDPILGPMHWVKDDEAWEGQYNNFKFQIGYYGTKLPDPAILAHAREILNDRPWLPKALALAKIEEKESLSADMRKFYEPEIDALTIESVSFWEKDRIFVSLDGGKDYRLWRMECEGRKCFGLGFDD